MRKNFISGSLIYKEIFMIDQEIKEYGSAIDELIDSVGVNNEAINLLKEKLRELQNKKSELINKKYEEI